MMELLNIAQTKTMQAHLQCNAQVKVFYKTVKKYLVSFVNNTALNWETLLLVLSLSYSTSYNSTITTTPFKLLFGETKNL